VFAITHGVNGDICGAPYCVEFPIFFACVIATCTRSDRVSGIEETPR
jgi:hypothetical protein